MFHLILTACLATNAAICGPVLLPKGDAATLSACQAGAARISEDWLSQQPQLVGAGAECHKNSAVSTVQLHQIAPGIWVRQGEIAQITAENRGRIANLAVVIGDARVAVIDAGSSRSEGQALYAAIRRLTDKPISHLVLTHLHPDHVFGASVFAEAGASVTASERMPQAMQARGASYLANMLRILGPAEMMGTAITPPDLLVTDGLSIDLGGRDLRLATVATAHTDNDLVARNSTTGTLFTGDLVFRGLTPVVDGSISGWLLWMEEGPGDAGLVVPGHGEVAEDWKLAVAKQYDLLIKLAGLVRDAIAAGKPMSVTVPEIVGALQAARGEWVAFDETIARDATAAFKELEWE